MAYGSSSGVFLALPDETNSTSTHGQNASVRSGRIPQTCCRWYCQPSPRTDEGTEKQDKLCCRWRRAEVVVAPATTRSVGHMSSYRFFFFELWETRKHTTKSSTCTKGSWVKPTSRTYSDADPGLLCPTAAAANVSFSIGPFLTNPKKITIRHFFA